MESMYRAEDYGTYRRAQKRKKGPSVITLNDKEQKKEGGVGAGTILGVVAIGGLIAGALYFATRAKAETNGNGNGNGGLLYDTVWETTGWDGNIELQECKAKYPYTGVRTCYPVGTKRALPPVIPPPPPPYQQQSTRLEMQ